MSELLNRLTASQFKVESGEQVIAVVRVVKTNRRNGRDSESRILCLTGLFYTMSNDTSP